MNARITYEVQWIGHPWDEKRRRAGTLAHCLVKVTTPEAGNVTVEPVAIFNLDSEAETFMGHVFSEGLDGKLVSIPPAWRELFRRSGGTR